MQLDRHISTHIRDSPQAMHRTKLKDLAIQTFIRWQELLTHCQPEVVPSPAPGPGKKGSGQALTRARACPPPLQLLSSWPGDGWRGRCGGRGDLHHPYQESDAQYGGTASG